MLSTDAEAIFGLSSKLSCMFVAFQNLFPGSTTLLARVKQAVAVLQAVAALSDAVVASRWTIEKA